MQIFYSGKISKLLGPVLALVIALSLVAANPLLTSTGAPNGVDSRHHLSLMASMQRSWTQGEYFPSWAEDTNWGYGSPLFHFRGSLTYHITSALQFAFELTSVQALRWLLMLCFLMCGVGMYLFCQRRSGKLGALIGGLIYVNSPYLFHVNADLRGAYPELVALSIFPLLLWRLDALRDAPGARNFLLVLLLEVALINSHNASAVMMTGIAFVWLAFEAVIQRINREASQLEGRGELWAALALFIGIMAAASFWLPALMEGESVTSQRISYDVGNDHWLPIGELFKIPVQFYGIDRPSLSDALHIGIAQWALAVVGIGGALALYIRGYRTLHPQTFLGAIFFFSLFVALTLLLASESALRIWDVAPPLRFLQFRWQLLGPIAVCMAYLASLNGLALGRLPRNFGLLACALAIAAPVVAGFAISRAMSWNYESADFSTASLITSRASATDQTEFIPSTASKAVDQSRFLEGYADGYAIDRFDRNLLPPGSQATLLQSAPEFQAWRISTPTAFEASILNFWWPGWRATVDGRDVPVAPSEPFGLISASLPAGDYTLRVYLGSTPLRDFAALVSALAVIVGLAFAWRLQRLRIMPRLYAAAPPLATNEVRGLYLACAIIVASLLIISFWPA